MDGYGEVLEAVEIGVDGLAVLVMLWGTTLAAWRMVASSFGGADAWVAALRIGRRDLGAFLLAGLELMIVSDLVGSVLSRSLDDLAFLGAIVVIRTTIGYFLGRELEELREEGPSDAREQGAAA